MEHDEQLIKRVRNFLANIPELKIEEISMFRCLTFMVNGKMCVGVSGSELMVRFDPGHQEIMEAKEGFRVMETKNGIYKGYGYISPIAVRSKRDLTFWIKQCLEFNPRAKASKKRDK